MSTERAQEVNDAQLMAYVDGELSEAERSKVEEALGIDHDFRVELEELSRAGHLVDDVLKNIMQEVQAGAFQQGLVTKQHAAVAENKPESLPVEVKAESVVERQHSIVEEPASNVVEDSPATEASNGKPVEPLIDKIEKSVTTEATQSQSIAAAPLVEAQASDKGSRSRGWSRLFMAVALVATAYGGYFYSQTQRASSMPESLAGIAADTPLSHALEKVRSNELYVATDGSGEMVSLLASFQSSDGRYCRQFEINSVAQLYSGLACKTSGRWHLEMLLAAGERVAAIEGFQPLPSRYKDAQRTVFDLLWDGRSLDKAEERLLIEKAWH